MHKQRQHALPARSGNEKINATVIDSLIENNFELEALLGRLNGKNPVCAIDTEADSLHSYREKLCLIQFGCEDELRIIDPLAIDNLGPLVEFMDRAEIWMHGADFDMSMLRRTFGRVPHVVFDTQVAARLTGFRRFGLAHLIEEFFGVKLSKQSQRADWGKRPITDRLAEYALNDVRYILPLRDALVPKLKELGRYEWFLESCASQRENVLARPGKSEDSVWRIPGSGKLSRRGLAYLREIWQWRDAEANRMDRPAFKILVNEKHISAAIASESDQKFELPPRFPKEVSERFRKAVERASRLNEEEWPTKPGGRRPEKDPGFGRAFEKLRRRRDKIASELDIDETLIASKSTLEQLVGDPDFAATGGLLRWQRELLFPGEEN